MNRHMEVAMERDVNARVENRRVDSHMHEGRL